MAAPSLRGDAERLWRLIATRTERGADTDAIDKKIWDLYGERWAVMFTDLAGFSRRVEQFGIIHFLQTIYEHQSLLYPVIEEHNGVLVKAEGDSLLLLFRGVRAAYDCAQAMLASCARVNVRRKPEEQILLCIGIGYGDVLRVGDEDVWGEQVNAASKLGEDTAKAGEILLTGAAHEQLPDVAAESLEVEVPASPHNFRVRSPT